MKQTGTAQVELIACAVLLFGAWCLVFGAVEPIPSKNQEPRTKNQEPRTKNQALTTLFILHSSFFIHE